MERYNYQKLDIYTKVIPTILTALWAILCLCVLKFNLFTPFLNELTLNSSYAYISLVLFFILLTLFEIPIFIYARKLSRSIKKRYGKENRTVLLSIRNPTDLSVWLLVTVFLELISEAYSKTYFIETVMILAALITITSMRLRLREIKRQADGGSGDVEDETHHAILAVISELDNLIKINLDSVARKNFSGKEESPDASLPRLACTGISSMRIFYNKLDNVPGPWLKAGVLHEIAHFKYKDLLIYWLMTLIGIIGTVLAVRWLLAMNWASILTGTTANSNVLEFPLAVILNVILGSLYLVIYRYYRRRSEYKADLFAVRVMGEYLPLSDLLDYLTKSNSKKIGIFNRLFFSTHPLVKKRQKKMKKFLEKISESIDTDGSFQPSAAPKLLLNTPLKVNRLFSKGKLRVGISSFILMVVVVVGLVMVQLQTQLTKVGLDSLGDQFSYIGYYRYNSNFNGYDIYSANGLNQNNATPEYLIPGDTFNLSSQSNEVVVIDSPNTNFPCLDGQTVGALTWYRQSEMGANSSIFASNSENYLDPSIDNFGNNLFYDKLSYSSTGKCQETAYYRNYRSPLNERLLISCSGILHCVGMMDPTPSPNSNMVAYLQIIGTANSQHIEIGTMTLKVLNMKTLKSQTVETCNLSMTCWPEEGLDWSYNGSEIAYSMNRSVMLWSRSSGRIYNLYSCKAIESCNYPENLSFSPNNNWVAFDINSNEGYGRLMAVNTTGTKYVNIAKLNQYIGMAYWSSFDSFKVKNVLR